MKCPKCEYLGFETGDRCRNCGYDFTLMTSADPVPDLDLHRDGDDAPPAAGDVWLNQPESASEPEPEPVRAIQGYAPPLPLFTSRDADDEPLIKLPAAPRPPLAVRRTPETPRLRTAPRITRKEPDPTFEFADEPEAASLLPAAVVTSVQADARSTRAPVAGGAPISGPGARLTAAIVDHAILLTIDLTVIYFTLKIAALTLSDWRLLPMVPLLLFLAFLKFAYFTAFTAVGGQTIGKMGAGIRVVAEDGALIDASRAMRRCLAGAVSIATLGAAFVPALFGADRRALHDRVAHTRVIAH